MEDYIGFSVPLSFESGELVTTITVSIEDDSVWEPDEIFYGRLVNTGIASVNIPHDTATVTILDDDGMLNNEYDYFFNCPSSIFVPLDSVCLKAHCMFLLSHYSSGVV